MDILIWIIFGLVAGALAKFLMPGDDPGGIVVTILIGIAGAIVGGFIGKFLNLGSAGTISIGGLVIAVGGAMLLLLGYRIIMKKKLGG